MTPAAREPEKVHCGHECVCEHYHSEEESPCNGTMRVKMSGFSVICPRDTRRSSGQQNPCEENGCTDIENCDEICEHQRIYSQVQLNEKIAAAVAEGRGKRDETMTAAQRKYILSFKEEDPLLMAYVEGQKNPSAEHDARVRAEERKKAISDICSALESIAVTESWVAMNAFVTSLRGERK